MPRRCTVCDHAELKAITEDLMRRVPYRKIQTQYGVSKSALDRHLSTHISQALRRLTQSEMSLPNAAAIAEPVLLQMRNLNLRALKILSDAETANDRNTALTAIRECRRNLELIAKLTGELDARVPGEAHGSQLAVVVQYVDRPQISVNSPAPMLETTKGES